MVQRKFKEVSEIWIRMNIPNQNPTFHMRPLFICLGNIHNLQALTLVCCWRGKVSLDVTWQDLNLTISDPMPLASLPLFLSLYPSFSLYLPKHTQTPEVGEKQGTLLLLSFSHYHTTSGAFSSHLISQKVRENRWESDGKLSPRRGEVLSLLSFMWG